MRLVYYPARKDLDRGWYWTSIMGFYIWKHLTSPRVWYRHKTSIKSVEEGCWEALASKSIVLASPSTAENMEEGRFCFWVCITFCIRFYSGNTIKNHVSYVFNYKERLVFVFLGGYYFLRISCINIDCSRHGRWKAGSYVFECEYCLCKIYSENTIKNRCSFTCSYRNR